MQWIRSSAVVGRASGEREESGGRAIAMKSRRESIISAVINLRYESKLREQFEYAQVVNNTVLIDRRTKWGNPFRVTSRLTHAEAVARYRVHLWQRIRAGEVSLEELARLDGCWLACWCAGDGHPCHGEVLERAAAWAARVLAERSDG